MKDKSIEFKRKLNSEKEWKTSADPWIVEHFEFLGFRRPSDFMKIRFYDFLNLDCVDNNRAEEMLVALSDYLHPRREEYPDYEKRLEEKKYERKWIKEHKNNIADVTIGIVLNDENLSKQGFLDIFDFITQNFYHSTEYDSKRYKYWNISEIPNRKKENSNE